MRTTALLAALLACLLAASTRPARAAFGAADESYASKLTRTLGVTGDV